MASRADSEDRFLGDAASPLPLVSVVVPTVEVNRYLQEAMQSVLGQSYSAVEIVVVFDGASVPEPLPDYLRDPRVTLVVHEMNEGTPAALNSGIAVAHGKYIARLDADDIALEGRIEAQVAFLEREASVVCVGTGSVLIDSEGSVIEGSESSPREGRVTRQLLTRNPLLHSSVMYRTSVVREIGGYAREMRRMQDYELYLRLARVGQLAALPQVLAAYRVHKNQFSRNTSPWAPYTRLLLRRRLELARSLGERGIVQLLRNTVWFLAQVARHYRLVRPGYVRRRIARQDAIR